METDAARDGLLLVVSGPSGVGKGTLLDRLLDLREDCVFSISATTRPARAGEVPGRHYYFVDHEQFNRWVEEGRFLEWNEVHDHLYGTPRDFVDRARRQGSHVVLDVDVKGGLQVMEQEPDAVSIFIAPPDLETLRRRLIQRGTESEEEIRRRLLVGRRELMNLNRYRYTVVNRTVEEAVREIGAIIDAECCRTERVLRSGLFSQLFPSWEEFRRGPAGESWR